MGSLSVISYTVAALVGLYTAFLGLITSLEIQRHVVYLHKVQMTWFKDLNVPESFGFLRDDLEAFLAIHVHDAAGTVAFEY